MQAQVVFRQLNNHLHVVEEGNLKLSYLHNRWLSLWHEMTSTHVQTMIAGTFRVQSYLSVKNVDLTQ